MEQILNQTQNPLEIMNWHQVSCERLPLCPSDLAYLEQQMAPVWVPALKRLPHTHTLLRVEIIRREIVSKTGKRWRQVGHEVSQREEVGERRSRVMRTKRLLFGDVVSNKNICVFI